MLACLACSAWAQLVSQHACRNEDVQLLLRAALQRSLQDCMIEWVSFLSLVCVLQLAGLKARHMPLVHNLKPVFFFCGG